MCGFAGFFDLSARTPQPAATAGAMAATLIHRGPDDNGTWSDDEAGLAFGFRRLSILDLSPQGHQPMVSHDGRWVVVFNGEIYNHAEVRTRLGGEVRWRGRSDTEVLLEAIAAWGPEQAVRRFDGMFAFAVWDRTERRLTLGRDRFGEKPLYWALSDGVMLFGSELRALAVHPAWNGAIDRDALALFLRMGWIPAPHTIHRRARKLEPGTLMTVAADGTATTTRYWSAAERAAEMSGRFTGSRADAVDQLDALLRRSVALRMQADVPVGVFLSGGIDSSLTAALMSRLSDGPIHSFTVGFDQAGLDESAHARAVADHLGTIHTELRIGEDEALTMVPDLPRLFDEPFADPAALPTALLARLTRKRVTVALSGDGADELFGGYGIYRSLPADWTRLSRIPLPLRRGLATGARMLAGPAEGLARVGAAFRRRRSHPGYRLGRAAEAFGAGSLAELLSLHYTRWRGMPSPVPLAQTLEPFGEAATRVDPALAVMLLDVGLYLADDLCVKTDRTTMAASLEARLPFLGTEIADFAWSLPPEFKIDGATGKAVLRDVLFRHVPRALVDRPKMGFEVPVGKWLNGRLRPWADDMLSEARLSRQGWLNAPLVAQCWREHRSGAKSWQTELWHVLMFQAWLEGQE
ncbi:asparagine synthase (glutamine-hydrolyzing) [Magnetospirillum fulvum]|uniref:asparagine synthase (glutamine-hydrolyzing) n=1 Tax=Magnetospirillum fulvum TaxID=1082 RepID=A0A1H6ISK2_MAGFU|nr:asparagine synthase (glutamine-hydrolyzing) [Magnetospirillum fulvum]SEH49256.1 asparagine synthase (glutamine-hydrolysing) [Magnetospirillum fulvum]